MHRHLFDFDFDRIARAGVWVVKMDFEIAFAAAVVWGAGVSGLFDEQLDGLAEELPAVGVAVGLGSAGQGGQTLVGYGAGDKVGFPASGGGSGTR